MQLNLRGLGNATQRKVFRWIQVVFGMPIWGYIYGPPGEVQQYLPMYRYVFVPVLVVSGFWLWKGHVVVKLFSKGSN